MSPTRVESVGRREFLLGALGAAAFSAFLTQANGAYAATPASADALKKIYGDAKPAQGKIVLDLPEIAENGNTVPFTVTVESPMTDKDYVKAIHIVSTGNPSPDVATFELTPLAGKASLSARMRLGTTQDVIAVAEMSDGKFYTTTRVVKVTIGGCGG